MPTIELTRLDNETFILDDLDFDHEQPCEHSQHQTTHTPEEYARYLIRSICPDCNRAADYFICESGWKRGGLGVRCNTTNQLYPRSQVWVIIREVRG